jgi:hypothetical protein
MFFDLTLFTFPINNPTFPFVASCCQLSRSSAIGVIKDAGTLNVMKNIFQGGYFSDDFQADFNLDISTEQICPTCSIQLPSPSLSDPCKVCAGCEDCCRDSLEMYWWKG